MSHIIAVANQKGGVGKTTTVHNLGAVLASDRPVLMLDLDAQASLTISCGLEPEEMARTTVNLLRNPGCPAAECVHHLTNNLHIIPSIIDLSPLELEIISRPARETILARAIAPIRANYDFILIDCPPQLSILTINALTCADSVFVPCKTDYLSYRGLPQLEDTIKMVQEYTNPNLQLLGAIATFYDSRIKDDKAVLKTMRNNYKILGVVKRLVAAKQGIYDGKAAVEYAPNSDIATAYKDIALWLKTLSRRREFA